MLNIDLTGKVALVTGGAGQLGRAMVRTLGKCGADVVIHFNQSEDMASCLVAEMRAIGLRATCISADITDRESVFAMKKAVYAGMDDPDIIVNNAVIQYDWKGVLEQGIEDYESQFRSCVMQNVLMAQAFVPAMIKKGWGRVIGINTECAMQNFPSQSAYVSGKRGMDGVLRVLAKEVGKHNISVNQVAPGWMISDRHREEGTEVQPEYEKSVPLGRRGTDQEVANVVAFLASDLASFITGAYIPVCGGNVMPAI
jgi:3-oxoacyl-[acyl-carrier protein] reductase